METLLNDFSVGLFAMQAIVLLIVILLMRKFAWKPILDALQDREDGIQEALESADKAKLEMQNLKASNEKLLQDARMERDAMLKEARDMKAEMISTAKTEAQQQADAMISQAQEAIELEKKAAIAELKAQMAALSINIAEKVVREELSNKDKQMKLVESMLSETTLN
ncbi:F0F1 ATP synthase subunit B [Bizionia sediminis]|uniref:ATP synthase subunit b n=1 Tax=Bizionia sediminis TaxID=1737064 RepID=A0ABW5KRD1_9FLAO